MSQSQTLAAQRPPLDLDHVNARMREVLSGVAKPRRNIEAHGDAEADAEELARRIDRSPTEPVDYEEAAKEQETEAYKRLVEDGSRPLYPIHLYDSVSQHPEEYQEPLQALVWPGSQVGQAPLLFLADLPETVGSMGGPSQMAKRQPRARR